MSPELQEKYLKFREICSHDLRSHISQSIMIAEHLLTEEKDEEKKEFLEEIKNSSKNALNLIDNNLPSKK